MSTVPATGTLSSAGIGSGLDVTSIVNKLVSIESQPLYDLQKSATGLNTTLSSVGQLTSYLSALRDAAHSLTSSSLWKGTAATSSDPSAITASSTDGAATGNYSVTVGRLAAAESAASGAFASASSTVGTGVMTISVGSWNADQSAFSAKSGATPVSITIDAGDTLAQIRDKINSANAGVTAAIVTDGSGARLAISAKDTGAANAFQIQVNDGGDGIDNDANGLSALAYDPANGTQGLVRNQQAVDAQATINGIPVTSASNTLSNVLDGLSITLNKVSAAPVTVGVAPNKDSITTAVNNFVTAYNTAMKYMRTQTAYDASKKTAGPLQGDMTIVGLTSQLRGLMGGSTTASSSLQHLSDMGLSVAEDGTLSVDSTKLSSAMNNLPEMQKALAATANAGDPAGANGLMQQIFKYADGATSFDGVLTTKTASINSRISDNSSRQSQMQDRINAYQARVQAQYTALDAQMGQLTALSTYVTQQMTMLNKSTK